MSFCLVAFASVLSGRSDITRQEEGSRNSLRASNFCQHPLVAVTARFSSISGQLSLIVQSLFLILGPELRRSSTISVLEVVNLWNPSTSHAVLTLHSHHQLVEFFLSSALQPATWYPMLTQPSSLVPASAVPFLTDSSVGWFPIPGQYSLARRGCLASLCSRSLGVVAHWYSLISDLPHFSLLFLQHFKLFITNLLYQTLVGLSLDPDWYNLHIWTWALKPEGEGRWRKLSQKSAPFNPVILQVLKSDVN